MSTEDMVVTCITDALEAGRIDTALMVLRHSAATLDRAIADYLEGEITEAIRGNV